MKANTPVGCPQCGGQMDLWQEGRRLAMTGLFASVTDWVEVDIYSCPACGRLAFFRTNFVPQPKKHVPVEPEPTEVDTAAFYVPGTGSWSNARSAARSIPVTMPFVPCAGPGVIGPVPGAANGFRQHSRSVPIAATAEMRNKRNRQAAAMVFHGRRCFSAQKSTPPHTAGYLRCSLAGTAGCGHPLGAPP